MRHCPRNKMTSHLNIITALKGRQCNFYETYDYLCQAEGVKPISQASWQQWIGHMD